MLTVSYVPEQFALGITIPIPNGEANSCQLEIESFRGITLIYFQKYLKIVFYSNMINILKPLTINLVSRQMLAVRMQFLRAQRC